MALRASRESSRMCIGSEEGSETGMDLGAGSETGMGLGDGGGAGAGAFATSRDLSGGEIHTAGEGGGAGADEGASCKWEAAEGVGGK